jgi:hypothetical protein
MPDAASQTKRLLKCLSDLRWAFKRLAAEVASELGEEHAQAGDQLGPTWQFMGDDESVGYTDGQTVALAIGASAVCEVSVFWNQDELRVLETVALEGDDDEYRLEVFGPTDLIVNNVEAAITSLERFLDFLSTVGTERILNAVNEIESRGLGAEAIPRNGV